MALYTVREGEVTEVTYSEAEAVCQDDRYGTEVVLCQCDTAEQALDLANRFDAGEITYDNIPGQDAIAHKLVGLWG